MRVESLTMVDGEVVSIAPRPGFARRTGVFLLRNPLTQIVVGGLLVGLAGSLAQQLGRLLPTPGGISPTSLLGAGAALAAYALFVRLYERRWPTEAGRVGLPLWLPAGFALGAGLLLASAGLVYAGGWSVVARTAERGDWPRLIATALIVQFGVAVIEELLLRGVFFRVLERSLGSWLALALSAVLFGFMHAGNPNATWWAAAGLALQAGVLLAAAYMASRSLWLPIGVHWGWNAMQAGVVGGTVSGHTTRAVLTVKPAGAEILSGGAFGLEGSVVATTVCATVAVVLCTIAIRRGQIQPGFWARRVESAHAESA
jgi:membrane protease YdiL (CAAX protease family)